MANSTSLGTTFSTTKKIVMFSFFCLFLALIVMDQSQSNAFLPLYNEAKSISMSYTGVTLGSLDLGVALSSMLIAPILLARLSTGTLLTVTAFCLGLITILGSLLDFLGNVLAYKISALLVYFNIGLINGVSYATMMSALVAIYPNNVATSTGIAESIAQAAYAGGPLLGAALYAFGGFEVSFVLLGSLFLVSTIPGFFVPNLTGGGEIQSQMYTEVENADDIMIMKKADKDEDTSEGDPKWSTLVDARLLFPIWHFTVSQILASFHIPLISLHAEKNLDSGVVWAGTALMLTAAMMCLSSPVLGILTDKYGPWKMMIASSIAFPLVYICVGPLPLLATLKITTSKTQLMLALSFLGIAIPMANLPAIPAMLSIYSSKYQGEVPKWANNALVSLYVSFYSVGLAIGLTLSGFVAPHVSFGWSTGTLGLLYILQSCACIFFCVNEMKISRRLVVGRDSSLSSGPEYKATNVSSPYTT